MSEQTPSESHDQISPEWQEEIKECFKVMAPKIYGVLLPLMRRDINLASVIVQETFRKATPKWRQLRKGTDEMRTAWLIQVAVYSAIDAFRRAETERRKWPQVCMHYSPPEVNVYEEAMTGIAVQHFMRVLKKMSPQRAMVAFLYWRCEWSNGEIAEALGITPGRVSQQVAKAKTTLRRELRRYVTFEPDELEGGAR
jgi:RNA polymerase sigma factor (sigma-70 family)